ncbi:hypothetical protein [Acinetobacter haemolyticus]|uniref:Lipoprotein n=1 Tax=Acinetobacter haemolyticus TaxID=29430 RepID=A0AAW4J9D1_ACIHA|nr:hypothetical protein [Acinetobacter haemolyticus]AZN69587.1 hypothetical protein DX910_16525 [Acinetobacter haemolyticus]MBO3657659.1 hypothetical protein [Acinetobacter haemolyticus]
MNIKNLIRCFGLLLALSILTACATPRILSHDIDGLCLITQQDFRLSKKTLKTLDTQYMLESPNAWVTPITIGYQEIGLVPNSTKLSIFRVYEAYESIGYFRPDIVVKIEQGKYKGIIASIPGFKESIADPVTRKRLADERGTFIFGSLWFTARDTIDIPRKVFSRSDVNKIKFNPEYLKKCD